MNSKAQAFVETLKTYKVENWFEVEEYHDDFDSVVFRGFIDAVGYRVPTFVILDTSIFSMIRLVLSQEEVRDEKRVEVLDYINQLNEDFKLCKYYINSADNKLYLDVCVPALDEQFNPTFLLRIMTDLLQDHLNQHMELLVRTMGGLTAEELAAVSEQVGSETTTAKKTTNVNKMATKKTGTKVATKKTGTKTATKKNSH